ncbi:uncharacterized protein LOC108739340 isoform X2 [Agrilus planipennis]|uniref:Uncharacterized protein LOC108739340 isoform X2 n=1 Tax=Agrilus planipennis TaxID=224129 RepID=A0A1W4X8G6_AGRPL|nr:uncharacterized protein LOC108739340 isoform X2 [Agrilus planipennis]XP_025837247.1 uncharacterized protein LOC108739340 isoform X2 [Agrilus planipennis]
MPRRRRYHRRKRYLKTLKKRNKRLQSESTTEDRKRENNATFDISKMTDVGLNITQIISPVCTPNLTPPSNVSLFCNIHSTSELLDNFAKTTEDRKSFLNNADFLKYDVENLPSATTNKETINCLSKSQSLKLRNEVAVQTESENTHLEEQKKTNAGCCEWNKADNLTNPVVIYKTPLKRLRDICFSPSQDFEEQHCTPMKDLSCRSLYTEYDKELFNAFSNSLDDPETEKKLYNKNDTFIRNKKTSTPLNKKVLDFKTDETFNINSSLTSENSKISEFLFSKCAATFPTTFSHLHKRKTTPRKYHQKFFKSKNFSINQHKKYPCLTHNYYINYAKFTNRSHNITLKHMSRINKIRFPTNKRSPDYTTKGRGINSRLLSKIVKCSNRFAKLPQKLSNIISWLGITFTKGMSSLCRLYSLNKTILSKTENLTNPTINNPNDSEPGVVCKNCDQNQVQISILTAKVGDLETEMNHIKREYQTQLTKLATKVGNFDLEMNHVKQEYQTQISSLTAQVDDLKNELKLQNEKIQKMTSTFFSNCNTYNSYQPSKSLQLDACGAPPPPPPPPPPPLLLAPAPIIRITSSTKLEKKMQKAGAENRPVISLDDILKVKLRKTAERKSPLRRLSPLKRSIQPIISSDMLRQIKLKPTSRSQTPLIDSSPLSATASPQASLMRILTNVDTNDSYEQARRRKRQGLPVNGPHCAN